MKLNKVYKNVARREGKKQQVNIAQISEVGKYLILELAKYRPEEVLEVINKMARKHNGFRAWEDRQ